MEYSYVLGKRSLEIGAIKLNPKDPFTWASGKRMPVYSDIRMHLWYPENRRLITTALSDLIKNAGLTDEDYDFIAGTSTAGIAPGSRIADAKDKPFIYIRDKPKDHGLKNRIEGIDAESDLRSLRGILIEDLISTGRSSVSAVQAIRDANGICNYCLSIFTYGFNDAYQMFAGGLPYDKEGHKLSSPCYTDSALTFERLLQIAVQMGKLDETDLEVMKSVQVEGLNWGINHSFPPITKKS